jgi:hypothetical protein
LAGVFKPFILFLVRSAFYIVVVFVLAQSVVSVVNVDSVTGTDRADAFRLMRGSG